MSVPTNPVAAVVLMTDDESNALVYAASWCRARARSTDPNEFPLQIAALLVGLRARLTTYRAFDAHGQSMDFGTDRGTNPQQ